ncbi:MAG TPA: NADH-quinone oxidoreductase subunit H, partial [Polyangiaceae bacterium]
SHLILTSGVVSLVFLGGPRLPGLTATDPAAGLWLQVCGALLFQAKTVLVLGSVLLLRFATNQVRLSEVAQLGVRYLLPGALLLLVGTYFWAFGSQSPLFLAARVPLSHGLFFLCALCAAHVVLRVVTQLSGERPRSAINPWL